MTAVLLVLAVVALVALNGFFVASEFALVRARRAALTLRQVDRIDEYLSACQVGITLASIGIGFLGEKALGDLIRHPLEGVVGVVAAAVVGVGFAYFVTTFAHITAGEQ